MAIYIAEVFFKKVLKYHELASSIISDRDQVFISNFWKGLFKMMGTQLQQSTSYHPQMGGQTEWVNQSLENYLWCMSTNRP